MINVEAVLSIQRMLLYTPALGISQGVHVYRRCNSCKIDSWLSYVTDIGGIKCVNIYSIVSLPYSICE